MERIKSGLVVVVVIAVLHEAIGLARRQMKIRNHRLRRLHRFFFLRVPLCNFVANFLVILIVGIMGIFTFQLYADGNTGVKAQGTIIVDFTGVNPESGTLVYRIFGKDIVAIIAGLNRSLPTDRQIDVCKVLGERAVDKSEACKGKEMEDAEISQAREAFLKELKNKYKKALAQRWLSRKNDNLEVYVFHTGKKAEIKIEEKKRKTRIAQDISILTKLIVSDITKAEMFISMVDRQYRLGKQYGTLLVTAALDKEKEEKMEIITGPAEHWFLSADLIVLKLSKVKFVGSQGTIEPRETPKVFYLGINWMIGDILKERQNLLKNFFVKGMLKFSKKPFDSYGFGIGYRFPKVKVLGIDISSFSVFGSWLWTKEQVEDKTKELTKRQIQFGISFNLDKAMGWVK
jgi:hypothetical protein